MGAQKDLTLQDLMQMSHDLRYLVEDLDMLSKFVNVDEMKSILEKKI